MSTPRKRRARDPGATRQAILESARTLLAKDGPEALSLSAVAQHAGVNRGTAYQHFETRENLVAATLHSVSDLMFRAVFGDPLTLGQRQVETDDMMHVTNRLSDFAMANPALCRIWLLQILALPDPSTDPFWREFAGSMGRFARTDLAEPDIDAEVWSVIALAGYFLWPVWAEAHSQSEEERAEQGRRFTREMLRVSLYGTLNANKLPDIAAQLGREKPPAKLRAVG